MTLAWLLLATALVLVGGPPPGPAPRRAISPRWLPVVAAAASVVGCVAVAGVIRGALVALAVAPVAAWIVVRLRDRRDQPAPSTSLALALDLVAVAMRAGQPLAAALALAAPAVAGVSGDGLAQVGGLLRLGAEPAVAWQAVADDRTLLPVAAAAVRSASSGLRLAAAFEQLAAEVRDQLRARAEARAQRAGVWAAAPLGLCFLPSFVCLGIIPIIVGIAGGIIGGAR